MIRLLYSTLFLFHTIYGLNLEEDTDKFVLETKQIHLMEYPDAFNPSIVRWQNILIMSFRVLIQKDHAEKGSTGNAADSLLGVVCLDNLFNPITKPQLLNSAVPDISKSEDPRLLIVQDRLYMIYSDNKTNRNWDGSYRVYVAELDFDGVRFSILYQEAIEDCKWLVDGKREKNWVPFNHDGNIFLAYSINPHRILHYLIGTGKGEAIAASSHQITWPWGELRGGTPALSIDGGEYLAFFHSSIPLSTTHSKDQYINHYFIGAYTFANTYPFHITRISQKPIIGKSFYEGKTHEPYWGPVCVVFPGGYVYDEHYIWIAYGRQDHELWVAKIDRSALFNSLKPLEGYTINNVTPHVPYF